MKLGKVEGFEDFREDVALLEHRKRFCDLEEDLVPLFNKNRMLYQWHVPTNSRGFLVYEGGKRWAYRGKHPKVKRIVFKKFPYKGVKYLRLRRTKKQGF